MASRQEGELPAVFSLIRLRDACRQFIDAARIGSYVDIADFFEYDPTLCELFESICDIAGYWRQEDKHHDDHSGCAGIIYSRTDDCGSVPHKQQSAELVLRSEEMSNISKVERHQNLCTLLNNTYLIKNNDYGDSFHEMFLEEGWASARIRLNDKLKRFKQLTRNPNSQQVKDESIRDTLIDLANYALMTVLEMDDIVEWPCEEDDMFAGCEQERVNE